MSTNLNEVTLIGRLGAKPEVRKVEDCKSKKPTFVTCKLATTTYWQQDGEAKESTEWHSLEIGGAAAGFVAEHCNVGDTLFVRGHLHTKKWRDEKNAVDRYTTVVRTHKVQLLRKKAEVEANPANQSATAKEAKASAAAA